MQKISLVILALLGLALTFNALTYINLDPTYGFLRLKQSAIETGWYLPAFYAHVLISGLILLIGFYQVWPGARRRFPLMHRAAGKGYVFGVLFFAGPGGLVMSLFIDRGPAVLTSFIAQSICWIIFTAKAWQSARHGDFVAHEKWMWRSFSLTLAAITLRLYIYFLSYSFDLSQAAGYSILSWLSWVPNLLLVEWWFRTKSSSTP